MDEHILLSPQAFFIACLLDGKIEIPQIQEAFSREFEGILVSPDDIFKIINQLDHLGALMTENYLHMKRKVESDFRNLPVRPAYFAGKSYPDKAADLKVFLDGLFTKEGGPGEKAVSGGAGNPARLLIAPHIDFLRGGHSYAHGYLDYFKHGKPETVFIFGVAHWAPPAPFILTRKNFETPFGVIETDLEIVTRLETACDWDPYEYETIHRMEHSIEFQTVMLSYLFGNNMKIVPVLCGSFLNQQEAITKFLNACRELLELRGEKASVIAGADLAHVGRRFGDDFDIDRRIVNQVESRDREDLTHALAGNADLFYESVMKDENSRRVCGLNAIYSALKISDGKISGGKLLHYGYAPDPSGGIVSFANILFK